VSCLPTLLLVGACAVAARGLAADVPAAPTEQVLEHHANAARSGLYVLPGLTWQAASHLQRDPQFGADVAGPIYSQPLYWRSAQDNRALQTLIAVGRRLYVAADQHVYGFAF